MTDSNERWADSSEKSTEGYGNIQDSTALGRGSDALCSISWEDLDAFYLGRIRSLKDQALFPSTTRGKIKQRTQIDGVRN